MLFKDYKINAKRALSGKWGMFVLTTLIYFLIIGAVHGFNFIGNLNFDFNNIKKINLGKINFKLNIISTILICLIDGPLLLSWANMSVDVLNNKEIDVANLFDGFRNFVKSFVLCLVNKILCFLWGLLFVVPGMVKSYAYSMSYYILAENPNMTQSEARKHSIKMMYGNKWRLFHLDLSFIGWYILVLLTFGILNFWVYPYIQVTKASFYQDIKSKYLESCENLTQ